MRPEEPSRPVNGYAAPQRYTHAVFFNVTETAAGTVRQLLPRELYRTRLLALIGQASVIQRIGRHLRLHTDVPEPRPARPPPCPVEPIEDQSQDASKFDAAW